MIPLERVPTLTITERNAIIEIIDLKECDGMSVANNTVRVTVEFRTFPTNSALADPTAMTFSAWTEDGRQIGTSVVIDSSDRISLGKYFYDYLIPRGYGRIDVEFSGTLEGSIITGKETILIEQG